MLIQLTLTLYFVGETLSRPTKEQIGADTLAISNVAKVRKARQALPPSSVPQQTRDSLLGSTITRNVLGSVANMLGGFGGMPMMPGSIGGMPMMPGAVGGMPMMPGAIGGMPMMSGAIGGMPMMPGAIGGMPMMPGAIGGMPMIPGAF